MPTVTASPSI